MCLVLKLDNGKVVSITHEQTESQTDNTRTDTPSTELVYRFQEIPKKYEHFINFGKRWMGNSFNFIFLHFHQLKRTISLQLKSLLCFLRVSETK